jgi:hypothetical protein
MTTFRLYAPTGMLGSGFPDASLEQALAWEPDYIGVDAGSTDHGPFYLGAGRPFFSRAAVKRDLQRLLRAAVPAGIPLLIGSAGTAGGAPHLAWTRAILAEIAAEEGLRFRLATIAAEPDRGLLQAALAAGRIEPLPDQPAPPLDATVLDQATRIVAMMGVEPFQAALAAGAQVVLAGRASDTAIFAAGPARELPPTAWGPLWHAAKVLECGAAAVTHRTAPDGLFAWVDETGFTVAPPNPAVRCTPASVAAHSLYENGDPYRLLEPGGMLDTTGARYQAVDARTVRVEGSCFRPEERYTVRLEGVRLVGYQTIALAGIRDPVILGQLDGWLATVSQRVAERVAALYGPALADRWRLAFRVYGRDGVLGRNEPTPTVDHEVGLVLEVTAPDQATATAICATACHIALHNPVPEWQGLISALAFPYTPAEIERGPVYTFCLNHRLVLEDPLAFFPIEVMEIG